LAVFFGFIHKRLFRINIIVFLLMSAFAKIVDVLLTIRPDDATTGMVTCMN